MNNRPEQARPFTAKKVTEDNGLLTPSLKVKRHAVTAAYADRVEALYRR